MACIYKITDLTNGKLYIGQTKQELWKRWESHKYNGKYDYNVSLIDATIYEKGADNFIIEVVEDCEVEDLDNKEIYWVAYYHTWIEDPLCNGYNLTPGGTGTYKEGGFNKKKVRVYNRQCEVIGEYTTFKEAREAVGVKRSGASLEKRPWIGDYYFQLASEPILTTIALMATIKHPWSKKGSTYKGHTTVSQFSISGEYIATYTSYRNAAEALGKDRIRGAHQIEKMIRHEHGRKTALGYIWQKGDSHILKNN